MKRSLLLLSLFLFFHLYYCYSYNYDSFHHDSSLFKSSNLNPDLLSFYPYCFAFSSFSSIPFLKIQVENRFLLKELMNKDFDFLFPYKKNLFRTNINHFGNINFGTFQFSIGYARLFANRFSVALQFYYLLYHARNYSSLNSVTFDFSLAAKISEKCSLGVAVFNPAHLKVNFSANSPLPISFNLIALYSLNPKLNTALHASLDLTASFDLSLALSFSPFNYLSFNFSVSLSHSSFSLFYQYSFIMFRLSNDFNYQLGYSPKLSLFFALKKY